MVFFDQISSLSRKLLRIYYTYNIDRHCNIYIYIKLNVSYSVIIIIHGDYPLV